MPALLEPKTKLGAAIRDRRRKRKYTQGDVAIAIGVKQGTVSSWELGDSVPERPEMLRLHLLLGVPFKAYWDDLRDTEGEEAAPVRSGGSVKHGYSTHLGEMASDLLELVAS